MNTSYQPNEGPNQIEYNKHYRPDLIQKNKLKNLMNPIPRKYVDKSKIEREAPLASFYSKKQIEEINERIKAKTKDAECGWDKYFKFEE